MSARRRVVTVGVAGDSLATVCPPRGVRLGSAKPSPSRVPPAGRPAAGPVGRGGLFHPRVGGGAIRLSKEQVASFVEQKCFVLSFVDDCVCADSWLTKANDRIYFREKHPANADSPSGPCRYAPVKNIRRMPIGATVRRRSTLSRIGLVAVPKVRSLEIESPFAPCGPKLPAEPPRKRCWDFERDETPEALERSCRTLAAHLLNHGTSQTPRRALDRTPRAGLARILRMPP